MNRYPNKETQSHRVALGVAAFAISAITLAVSLLVPAKMAPGLWESRPSAISPTAADGVGSRMRIDVIGVREPGMTAVQARDAQTKRKQQG